MTQVFRNQTFRGLGFDDRDSGRVFSDLEFYRCNFQNIALSITFDPAKRSTVRGVKLVNCSEESCHLWPAILEDVTVDGLETAQLFVANACAYKHVVLSGKLGDVKICRSVPWASAPAGYLARKQEATDRANADYYESVDWALDISQAEFTSGEVEGIPPELVRRDPATQFVLRAKAIKERRWREVDLSGTYWFPLLDAYAKEGMGDVVLVAPKAAPEFKALLKGLIALREAGIVEPG
jgi:hypothetical protein